MSSSRWKASHSCSVGRVMGQNPQFDLRIVGRQQRPALLAGHEGRADLPPRLGPHGDVLQVRIAGTEPARGRHHLVERGVHPAGRGMDHLRQGVDVGPLQLGVLPILDDLRRQRMLRGQLLQHVRVGARAGLAVRLSIGSFCSTNSTRLQLLGRGDVERAGRPVGKSPARSLPSARQSGGSARPAGPRRRLMPLYSISTSTSISGISTLRTDRQVRPPRASAPGSAASATAARRPRPRSR